MERNDKDAYDRDVFEATEIEMSNNPASQTLIGLYSCLQTIHHPLCCHFRAQWDKSFSKLHMPKKKMVENSNTLTQQLLIIL